MIVPEGIDEMGIPVESSRFIPAGALAAKGEKMRHRLIWSVMAVAAVMPAFGGTVSVNLGSASSFGLLGGTISNTGTSVVTGNVGATTTITGFPPATATGTVYAFPSDPPVAAAYSDFENAFSAALLLPTISPYDPNLCPTAGDLTGNCTFFGNNAYELPLTSISSTTGINLTFDAQNNPNEIFVIRIDQAFTVNGAMTFTLENGAKQDNIFWIVGTDATISVTTSGPITFDGNILAGDTFSMSAAGGGSGVLAGTIDGCVFAENANTLGGRTDVGGCSDTAGRVPEPGTLTLLSLGLGAGCLLLRKFRSIR